ncbi:hypothetical protein ONZ51_g10331 [Trametes cubensis]|uniref:Uncharacterized protein n=1 Tax=Trametes cubensis TaxID=1111947 RepID=A0AAD7TMA5_9APHY|nr:hypothetical protein ONZ51_g10331 [Trametes cubensis]
MPPTPGSVLVDPRLRPAQVTDELLTITSSSTEKNPTNTLTLTSSSTAKHPTRSLSPTASARRDGAQALVLSRARCYGGFLKWQTPPLALLDLPKQVQTRAAVKARTTSQ